VLKVIIDTNVLISALIWAGNPRQLFDAGLDAGWRFYTTVALLGEFQRVLNYPKIAKALERKQKSHAEMTDLALSILRSVDAPALSAPVCRDPDDDAVLACALAVKADLIISSDNDLLVLGRFEGIPILAVAQALTLLPGSAAQ
jgi:uncharacterized protein